MALLTARLSIVWCFFWSRPYGLDWPIERIFPVPGWTCTTDAATLSPLLTFEVAASLAACCARRESRPDGQPAEVPELGALLVGLAEGRVVQDGLAHVVAEEVAPLTAVMHPLFGLLTFSSTGTAMAFAASSWEMSPTAAMRSSTVLRRLVASSVSLTGS